MNSLPRLLSIALLASLAAAPTLPAALVFHEPFDYTVGDLTAANGGTGFTNAWSTGGTTLKVTSPGLSTIGLPGTGNTAQDTDSTSRSNLRGFDATGLTNDGSQVWVSALVQITSTSTSDLRIQFLANGNLQGSGLALYARGNGELDAQVSGARPKDIVPVPTSFTFGSAGTLITGVGAPVYLLVGRFDFSNTTLSDALYIWVNPVVGTTPPLESAAVVSATGLNFPSTGGGFLGSDLRIAGGGGFVGSVDEIRLGTSFADVVAVPEPGALATLLGLGTLVAVAAGRRSHRRS